jgi:hypothetical protein
MMLLSEHGIKSPATSTLLPREVLKRCHTGKGFRNYDVTVEVMFMPPRVHLRLRNDLGK